MLFLKQLKMIMNNEVWKDIEDFEGKFQISNLGRVRSLFIRNQYGISKKIRIKKLLINLKVLLKREK